MLQIDEYVQPTHDISGIFQFEMNWTSVIVMEPRVTSDRRPCWPDRTGCTVQQERRSTGPWLEYTRQ